MALFSDAWMGELLSKNDIVSIVSEYVLLKPKGRRMWGCCPFHSEKTPSFSVTQDKQLYYCFGCHAGGSVVQFVMEMEKLTYVEAIKHLAQRVGMELPSDVDDEKLRLERAKMERLYAACVEAARYYHDMLMGEGGAGARKYLISRGINGEMARRFGLGYAPNGWDNLTDYLNGKGYSREELISAGLAISGKKKDAFYDAYRGRIIYPIIATTGRVIGFGARAMGDELPKYINTGDTPIYNKRNNLYAMNMLKGKHITDIIMVEGYMDVISLYRSGIDNAVASLGTALTQQQARLIKRYVPMVYIAYDGDAAGQNATIRGMEILAKEGLDVRVISVPDGMDPDDYVKKNGKDAFLSLKSAALTLNASKLESIAREFDMDTENGREGYAKKACAFAGTLEPVERERYAPIIARMSGLATTTIKAQFGIATKVKQNNIAKNRHNRSEKTVKMDDLKSKTELELLSCMMISKQAALAAMERMAKECLGFETEGMDELANGLLVQYAYDDELNIQLVTSGLDGRSSELIAAAEAYQDSIVDPVAAAQECVSGLLRMHLTARIKQLSVMAQNIDDAGAKDAFIEMERMTKKLNGLK
ncbi:MAG: DNA primase [Clostridia bacterium]